MNITNNEIVQNSKSEPKKFSILCTGTFNPRQRARKLSLFSISNAKDMKSINSSGTISLYHWSRSGQIYNFCLTASRFIICFKGFVFDFTVSRQNNKRDTTTNVDDNFLMISSQRITDPGSQIPNEYNRSGMQVYTWMVTVYGISWYHTYVVNYQQVDNGTAPVIINTY